ncbi:MAG: DUF3459 domain-containing protein [Anaerolineaceae bacterium]|nr:DUF3459 domain-containing protein [Anaerolineaceae bacterium]
MKNISRFPLLQLFSLIIIFSCLLVSCQPGSSPTAASATQTLAATDTELPPPTAAPIDLPAYDPGQIRWWDGTVFYEIFVRSFYDSNGDGTGDFNGITEKLDYLNDGDPATTTDLGVTGIWLMPIFPSPSYHGYDVTDYYTVNPQYGTVEDFKNLLAEAHKRGIRVIIDLVINHTSEQHPWFEQANDPTSPYHDWYIWSEKDPGYPGPWSETVWHKGDNGLFYYGIFWSGMPDLNFNNPEVNEEMYEVARFWLEDMDVDGFRLDAALHIIEDGEIQANTPQTIEWLQGFTTYVHEVNSDALVLGEVWASSYTVMQYLQTDALDMAFNFDLASAIIENVIRQDAANLASAIELETDVYKRESAGIFLTNHDMDRVMSVVNLEEEKAKAAATILFTYPGTPFIYYGEEIGMTGQKPDEMIRTPMQWSNTTNAGFTSGNPWEKPSLLYQYYNVADQDLNEGSLLNHYRQLIHLRQEHPALQYGQFIKLSSSSPQVLASLRILGDEVILTILNLGDETATGFTFSARDLPVQGDFSPTPLMGSGILPHMVIEDTGRLEDFIPMAALGANANLVILYQKK